jgi:hypothetical protein
MEEHVTGMQEIYTKFWSENLKRKTNIKMELTDKESRNSSVAIAGGAGNFSLHHRVQNGSGAHPASYPMCTRGSFLGVKRPGREADHSPPSSAEVKECVELYLHSPNTPSWRGAQLNHRRTLPFYFYLTDKVI